ncbi:helix-turn-helix transcriptional regulator [Campylobacter sp. RM16187]|uniref:helix-turn-helix transcriptional regulator n=1 Tax=Campylobacter sp. RM16187 TaxID=1660063 RepID=UPI0021B5DA87|nr:WYL domain-containing protein [Campylobacter sp. RM16187]QKG28713.1 transcriptional regulator (WYL domain) [Campylobacter sp. RM16187]
MDAQTRILWLLKKLNRGEIIDTAQDELWINEKDDKPRLNYKTVRRDFEAIKNVFNEIEIKRTESGCYQAINTNLLDDLLDERKRNVLKIIYAMLDKNSQKFNDNSKKTAISQMLNESFGVYDFITSPIETELDKNVIKTLEDAIRYRKKLAIEYTPTNKTDRKKFKEVKPYKILLINENLYLANTNNEYDFSLFRIAGITNLEVVKGETFNHDYNIDDFIKSIQTPFAVFSHKWKTSLVEVRLEISPKKAFLFERKNFFQSQKIIERKPDGAIVVSYHFSDLKEIEFFIMEFLGYIKILAPMELKQKIIKKIEEGKNLL